MAKNDKPSFKVACSICGKRSSTTNKKYKKEPYICRECRAKLKAKNNSKKTLQKTSKKKSVKKISHTTTKNTNKKPSKKTLKNPVKKTLKKSVSKKPIKQTKKVSKKVTPEYKKKVLTKDFPQINNNTKIDVNDLDSDLPIDLEKYLNAFKQIKKKNRDNHPNIIFTKLFVITAILFILCFIIYKLIFG